MVRPWLCSRFSRGLLDLSGSRPPWLRRSASRESWRFHHWLRALRRDRRWPTWLRLFLQAGDVARADVDLASVGRWNVESRRNDRDPALHSLLCAAAQDFLEQPRRQSGSGRADRIVLGPLCQFYQWRTLRTRDERLVGDAVPKRAHRKCR